MENIYPKPEVWKPVMGYEDFYKVSSYGRVMSLRKGMIMSQHENKCRRQSLGRGSGYLKVGLSKDGNYSKFYTHHLVIYAFTGPRPNGLEVHHKDENPLNNHIDNLGYMTPRDNTAESVKGKNPRGVIWDKSKKRWESYTSIRKKRITLGQFKTKEMAAACSMMANQFLNSIVSMPKDKQMELLKNKRSDFRDIARGKIS